MVFLKKNYFKRNRVRKVQKQNPLKLKKSFLLVKNYLWLNNETCLENIC